jgi:putative ABC transport system permease protein
MDLWLQDFYYKISLEPWIFAVAGIATMFIALTTVSYQAIKAGTANPVEALMNE